VAFAIPLLLSSRAHRTVFSAFFRLSRLTCAALVGSLLWMGNVPAAPAINILLSESAGIYQEAANSLASQLHRINGNWTINTTSLDNYSANEGDLTVAIGTRALEAALAAPGDRPVLSLLVPQLSFDRLANGSRKTSALYLDQPLARQLRLLDAALPGLKKVGVPLGPASSGFQTALEQAQKASGVKVDSVVISQGSDLLTSLTDLAESSQAFLLLPDPLVVQRSTLQSFFLHTYRLRKPVLAYSAPLVQSGALLGLYTTPAQLGEEAAIWISESWSRGEFRLGTPRHPKRFTISVNRTVARSLDISLPSEAELAQRLEALQ
jgi:ABC-type uncharacterized transport system substrate-binding protein